MVSQSGEQTKLNFPGESAEEAENFVQAVHRRAFAAGRQKDNAWIAEFACTCFSKKALRWYDTLDDETQNDWKLLRRATLAEFTATPPAPATVPSGALALSSSPSSTTPPSAVTVRIGRIRVDSEDHSKSGYLCLDTRVLGAVVADPSQANIFEVDTLAQTLRLKGSGASIAIRGHGGNWPPNPGTYTYACIIKSSADLGTLWNDTWSIAKDGNITATFRRTDGSRYDANFMITTVVLHEFDVIHVPADKEA